MLDVPKNFEKNGFIFCSSNKFNFAFVAELRYTAHFNCVSYFTYHVILSSEIVSVQKY